jgi:hypothetical protein
MLRPESPMCRRHLIPSSVRYIIGEVCISLTGITISTGIADMSGLSPVTGIIVAIGYRVLRLPQVSS